VRGDAVLFGLHVHTLLGLAAACSPKNQDNNFLDNLFQPVTPKNLDNNFLNTLLDNNFLNNNFSETIFNSFSRRDTYAETQSTG
tara:strand:- start:193 stop:444 length:252 start_codon:yes stop_codon:yes gene_type:complete